MTLEELENEIDDIEYVESFDEGESRLYLTNIALVSNEYNLTIRTGVWCEKNDDGEYESDWAFTLIHHSDDTPDHYIYLEQDDITTTLHNFANMYDINKELLYEDLGMAA